MGSVVNQSACPACASSDAYTVYDDDSAFCFSCRKYFPPDGMTERRSNMIEDSESWRPMRGEYMAMPRRKITEETCRKAGVQYDGEKVIFNIRAPGGALIAQKTRDKDKNFAIQGPARKDLPIYLSWTWPAKGKAVTLVEGEIDALSYWQAWDHRWPIGSLPNGASAKKAIMKHYEQLLQFETIYLCFDNDEPGQKATEEACQLLPVGRVKIIRLPEDCKDANDVLMKHGPQALVKAFYDAQTYRPDGIRSGREFTRERLKQKRRAGFSLPWPKLNGMWMGLRDAEITTLCAGSGIGKSTLARHMAYHLRTEHGLKIGNIFLEEDNDTSVAAYVALHQGVPLKRLLAAPESLPDAMWDASLAAVVWDGMLFYDHFGSLESDRLLTMMRYMAASGCRFIVLDHISIVVSGLDTNDERKDIDVLMTKLASFVKETGCGVIAVVHLKRGKSYNEGDRISITDMRGSASIEQLSFNLLALERDQQDEDKKLYATMRSLKCRITGETGEADTLKWNVEKGCYELSSPFEDDTPPFDPHQSETEDAPF